MYGTYHHICDELAALESEVVAVVFSTEIRRSFVHVLPPTVSTVIL